MKKMNIKNVTKTSAKLVLMTTLMTTLAAAPVYADSTINVVKFQMNIQLQEGDTLPNLELGYTDNDSVNVAIPENTRYDIVGYEWVKEVDEVEMGESYKLKVTLDALDDYKFKTSYSSSKVTVKGGDFVSARRNAEGQLIVTLATDEVEGILDIPEDPRWISENSSNSKFGYAKWDSVEDAAYDVYLYRNDKIVKRISGVKNTSIDLYPYMTKEGDYTFRVRAVPKNDNVEEYAERSEWNESYELYVDEDEVSDGKEQTTSNNSNNQNDIDVSAPANTTQVGWIQSQGKWFFRFPDGTYLRNSWGEISGKWYLFDNNGVMQTDWQKVNNYYYYMNQDGAMQTGWILQNGIWYYLNPSGAMATGWITVNGLTYYMETSGAMATGWKNISGQYYYFYPDGHKAVNEVVQGFYVDSNGVWKRP